MKGCKVGLTIFAPTGRPRPLCDKPVVAHGLCAKHYADRLRLGGAA